VTRRFIDLSIGVPYVLKRPTRPPELPQSPSLTEALANLGKRRGPPGEHDRPRRLPVPPHLRPTRGRLSIFGGIHLGDDDD
jgi:hypothetical protein